MSRRPSEGFVQWIIILFVMLAITITWSEVHAIFNDGFEDVMYLDIDGVVITCRDPVRIDTFNDTVFCESP